jgi:hypothetical protein
MVSKNSGTHVQLLVVPILAPLFLIYICEDTGDGAGIGGDDCVGHWREERDRARAELKRKRKRKSGEKKKTEERKDGDCEVWWDRKKRRN